MFVIRHSLELATGGSRESMRHPQGPNSGIAGQNEFWLLPFETRLTQLTENS